MPRTKRSRWWRGWNRAAGSALVLLAVACGNPPVQDEVTIEFSQDQSVSITAETRFDLQPRNPIAHGKAELAREAALAGTDQWLVRFTRLRPETERLVFERTGGQLERVTRSGRIGQDELQQFFADTSITVAHLRGDDWQELSLYTGTSHRASREQMRRFDGELQIWARAVARYYSSLSVLYAYLDAHPQRARYVFAALIGEKAPDGTETGVTEEEEPLVEAVSSAMEEIATRLDLQDDRAETLAEDADTIFNPFPAKMTIRVPGEILSSEGFLDAEGTRAVVEPVDLFSTIAGLEGRWAEPDPLTALLRDQTPPAVNLAAIPRRATPVVSASEIVTAVKERLTRPRTYRVRWRG